MRTPFFWLMSAVVVSWIALAFAWLYTPSNPMVYESGYVTPAVVRAGEKFYVSRTFMVTREESLKINRVMIRGDCRVKCDKVTLPSSELYVTRGRYVDNIIPYVVPFPAQAGKYKLLFTVSWQDRFGHALSEPMPELEIEIVQ